MQARLGLRINDLTQKFNTPLLHAQTRGALADRCDAAAAAAAWRAALPLPAADRALGAALAALAHPALLQRQRRGCGCPHPWPHSLSKSSLPLPAVRPRPGGSRLPYASLFQ